MAEKINIGMPQTRGVFQLSGIVTGVEKNNFYSEGVGNSGRAWRRVNLGIEIESGKTVYVQCFGAVQDNVYFSKVVDKKAETRAIAWKDRFQDMGDFRIIGVTTGCTKVYDEKKNKEVNNTLHLTPYDACEEIKNLHDGDSVFVRGNISYSEYNGKHQTNFEITQISLCSPIDLSKEGYEPTAYFTQNIVLMGVEKNVETSDFTVNASIVGYNTIENTELYLENQKLAVNLNKLKKNVGIKVYGNIVVESNVEEVEEDSGDWGTSNKMERVTSPYTRKLLITGADKDSIDKEEFTEDKFEQAMAIINSSKRSKVEYGKKNDDDWGSDSNIDDDDLGLPDGW